MLTNPPLISIITCTKNSGRFLNECLKSVDQQTYRHFEHIFIDTNSSDETLEIIKNYKHSRSKLINFSTSGIYQAFNEGLRQANGNIVGFLHSDDIFSDTQCLERIATAFIMNSKINYYCSKMNICDQNLNIRFAILGAPPHTTSWREELYSLFYFAHPTYFCRKSIINKIGFYNENYCYAGDSDWLKRLELLNTPYYFDNKPLINFRTNGASATHSLVSLKEESLIKLKYEGFSFRFVVICTWHLFRRLIRSFLNTLGLKKIIFWSRELILKTFKI